MRNFALHLSASRSLFRQGAAFNSELLKVQLTKHLLVNALCSEDIVRFTFFVKILSNLVLELHKNLRLFEIEVFLPNTLVFSKKPFHIFTWVCNLNYFPRLISLSSCYIVQFSKYNFKYWVLLNTCVLNVIQTYGLYVTRIALRANCAISATLLPMFFRFAKKPFDSRAITPWHIPRLQSKRWWRWGESNSWPPACKAGALPAELHPQILHNSVLLFGFYSDLQSALQFTSDCNVSHLQSKC